MVTVPPYTRKFFDLPNDGFTLNSVPDPVDDLHGLLKAFDFRGTDDRAYQAGSWGIEDGVVFTVSCWVKTTDTSGVILGNFKNLGTTDIGGFYIATDPTVGISGEVFDNGIKAQRLIWTVTDGVALVDGKWHHLVVTINDNTPKAYLDGVPLTMDIVFAARGGAGFGGTQRDFTLGDFSEQTNRPFAGSIARVKLWDGTELDTDEAPQEHLNECAAAFVNPTTDEYLHLNKAGNPFIRNNITKIINDQFNQNAGVEFDGVGGWYDSLERPLDTGSGVQHTFSFPLRYLAGDSPDQATIIAQRGIGTDAFMLRVAGTDLRIQFDDISGGRIRSDIASGERNWDDGNWHIITIRSNTNEADIFVDGVEADYSSHNIIVTTGFVTGFAVDPLPLSLGSRSAGAFSVKCDMGGMIEFWEGTSLHECQILKHFEILEELMKSSLRKFPLLNMAS